VSEGTRGTVLGVDDNPAGLSALEYNLSTAGFAVVRAVNGREALDRCSETTPDVIVSDVTMPEMDGIEFCRQVREARSMGSVPFVFLTARAEPEEKRLGLRSGADDYIVKPFDMDELILRLEILMDRVKKTRGSMALNGRLRDVSLPDLLQMFEMTRKVGRLKLESAGGERAFIDFNDGIVAGVKVDGVDGDEDAFFSLLGWSDAEFSFESRPVDGGGLMKPAAFLLMEGMRLVDERSSLGDFLPEPGTRYALVWEPEGDDRTEETERICEYLNHRPMTLEELSVKTGWGACRTEVALGKLIRAGLVAPEDQPAISHGEESERPAAATLEKGASAETAPSCVCRPGRVLLAYTEDAPIDEFLSSLSVAFGLSRDKVATKGVADYVNLRSGGDEIQLFLVRGEKRFSFMWDMVADGLGGGLFLSDAGPSARDDARFFRERIEQAVGCRVYWLRGDPPAGDDEDGDTMFCNMGSAAGVRTVIETILSNIGR